MSDCNYNRSDDNPVHQHADGDWYFYDETWAFEHGPFKTELEAEDRCGWYVKEILGVNKIKEREAI